MLFSILDVRLIHHSSLYAGPLPVVDVVDVVGAGEDDELAGDVVVVVIGQNDGGSTATSPALTPHPSTIRFTPAESTQSY